MGNPIQKEGNAPENPPAAKTEKDPPSRQNSEPVGTPTDKGGAAPQRKKPSVRAKLDHYREVGRQQREAERTEPTPHREETLKSPPKNGQTVHHQPKPKRKPKAR